MRLSVECRTFQRISPGGSHMLGCVTKIQKTKLGRENIFGGVIRRQKRAQRGGLPRNSIPQ